MSDTAAQPEDYYSLFEIPSEAGTDEIRKLLRESRRRWRQQAGSPDLERRRRAEQRMEQIESAEQVLLDAQARADYDSSLAAHRNAAPPARPSASRNSSTDWGSRAAEYLETDDPRNALLAAKRGTEADPEDTKSWLMYARAATALEKHDEADFASAELLHRVPGAANLQFRADILEKTERFAEAELLFRRASDMEPESPYYPSRAAWSVLDQGRIDEAVAETWTVIERFPDAEFPPRVLREAARVLREKEELERSLGVAEPLVRHQSDVDDSMLQAVLTIEAMATNGRRAAALAHAQRFLRDFPDSRRPVVAIQYVISTIHNAGETSTAVAALWPLLDQLPQEEFPPTFLRAAIERFRTQGKYQTAIAIGTRLLRARPADDDAMEQTALALEGLAAAGEVDQAILLTKQLMEEFPSSSRPPRALLAMTTTMPQHGRAADALALARELADRFPHSDGVRLRLGWALLREAQARMAQLGEGSYAILNRAQADYAAAALAEIESLQIADAGLDAAVDATRAYHSEQTSIAVKFTAKRIVLAIVVMILALIGLDQLFLPGIVFLLIAGLLGWLFWARTFARKYRRDQALVSPQVRASGLQRWRPSDPAATAAPASAEQG